jgi:hypothetical protein
MLQSQRVNEVIGPVAQVKDGANGHKRRRRKQIHHDFRRTALAGDAACDIAELRGISLSEAALCCNTSPVHAHAMDKIRTCGDKLLHDEVMTGTQPVLASAEMVENASIAIKAYAKFSRYERYLFEAKTGAVKDLTKHIANSDPVEAAAALIKATGSIDTAVDLLIAAERSIVSMALVSEPVDLVVKT